MYYVLFSYSLILSAPGVWVNAGNQIQSHANTYLVAGNPLQPSCQR
jgi:hypothetical protein